MTEDGRSAGAAVSDRANVSSREARQVCTAAGEGSTDDSLTAEERRALKGAKDVGAMAAARKIRARATVRSRASNAAMVRAITTSSSARAAAVVKAARADVSAKAATNTVASLKVVKVAVITATKAAVGK